MGLTLIWGQTYEKINSISTNRGGKNEEIKQASRQTLNFPKWLVTFLPFSLGEQKKILLFARNLN